VAFFVILAGRYRPMHPKAAEQAWLSPEACFAQRLRH
jgi:hypothetical protein